MVNINTVYQTVLYILNKEQRGYIPPSEFNSLAQLVQHEIFNSYFPDGNQLNRQNQNNTQNDTEFFNIFENNRYKLYPFEHESSWQYDSTEDCWSINSPGLSTVRLLGVITSTYNNKSQTNTDPGAQIGPTITSITQNVSKNDYEKLIRSKLTAPTSQYPIAFQTSLTNNQPEEDVILKVYPKPDSLKVNCIFEPVPPSWQFITGGLGQYVYNASGSVNFQLDNSEMSNLIINILKYAGVIINDPTVIEVAASEAQGVEVNEKS